MHAKHVKRIKNTMHLGRRLKTPCTHVEHVKRIKNTRHIGRGLKAPSMHGKHTKRIESTKQMPKVSNKDQQHLTCIKHTQ